MSDSPEMLDFKAFKAKYEKVPVEEHPNNVVNAVPEPVVSVQISTYQHVDFIRDCLEGVLMQETDFPVEILIGEDESDDGTREICKEYADRYPDKIRLLLHRRENNIKVHGRPTPNFQWNYTRFVCRGKYIAICEGDDYWTDPLKLQKQVDFLEANPEYVLSHHDAAIIEAGGKQLSASKLPDENKRDFSQEGLMKGPFLLTLSLCFRNVVESYPEGFFHVLNGDKFLISLVGQHGKGAYQEKIKPAVYRTHDESIWSSRTSKHKSELLSDTFRRLNMYYAKEAAGVASYYSDRHISSKKGVYYAGVREGAYRDSFHTWTYVVWYYAKRKNYRQAVSFGLNAFRFLLGDIRRRLLNS
jgi:glycosyltransferase involved in cell wall biosynthesis